MILIIGTMIIAAFLYEWAADMVTDKSFREINKDEAIELGLSSDEVEEYKIFDPEVAGKYLFIMQMTYHISWPIRKITNTILNR